MMDHLSDNEWAATLKNIKIYHFLGSKPWKRKAGAHINRLWWSYKKEIEDQLNVQLSS
jgi:lipopolysaccharide biosynthesis glycosyltransferase